MTDHEDDLGGLEISVHSETNPGVLTSASKEELFLAVTSALREMSRLDHVLDLRLSSHSTRRSDLPPLFEKDESTGENSLCGCGDGEVVASEDSSSWFTVSSEDSPHEERLLVGRNMSETIKECKQSNFDLEKEVEHFLSSTDGDSERETLSFEDVTSINDLDSTDTSSTNEITDHSYMRKLTGNAAEVMDSLGNSLSDSLGETETDPLNVLENQPVFDLDSGLNFSAKKYLTNQFQKVTKMRNEEQLNLAEMKRKIANLRKAAQADWNNVEEPIRALRIPVDVSKKEPSDLLALEDRTSFVSHESNEELDVATLTADKLIGGSNAWKRWRTALADLHRSQSADLFTEPGFLEDSSLDSIAEFDADNINKKMKSLKNIVRSASQELNHIKRIGIKQ